MARRSKNLMNSDIRKAAILADVRMWEICERLNISEPTLVRWLRFELPEEKRTAILTAIKEISEEE